MNSSQFEYFKQQRRKKLLRQLAMKGGAALAAYYFPITAGIIGTAMVVQKFYDEYSNL